MIHGDSDLTVPYDDAHRLQGALDAAGVRDEVVTIERGGHGAWRMTE